MAGRAFVVAKGVFIMETVVLWHCDNGLMTKKQIFWCKFSYVNNLYSVINCNPVKVRYIEPWNFLNKRALVSQPSTIVSANKDPNISHYLNLSIYLPTIILAIILYTPTMTVHHK